MKLILNGSERIQGSCTVCVVGVSGVCGELIHDVGVKIQVPVRSACIDSYTTLPRITFFRFLCFTV